mgnify:CR=1 FL=1
MNDLKHTLTDTQSLALAMVKDRPRLTIEDYANMMGNTEEIYRAFGWLLANQYLKADERTGSVTIKGII